MNKKIFKNTYIEDHEISKEAFANNDKDSAIENNKNDLASNQGNSGIKDIKMGEEKSKIELEYQMRSERVERDEENPMYDASDEPFGAPDRF
ncbi:MAG: hypothetical protein CVU84_08190 [Firmicutes bacterium HGW-Firmicutes-1]|nr:MAG: hypothetical protein CVU84_08190 [Firmicutes bacterium HGW-Firmicutes-1]